MTDRTQRQRLQMRGLPVPGGDLPPGVTPRGPSKEEIAAQVPTGEFEPPISDTLYAPILPCELVSVCIRKLVVSRASYLFEPLAALSDWDITFTVIGAPWTWHVGHVDPGTEHQVYFCRFVRLDPYGQVTVAVGGTNSDSGALDELPPATASHGADDNWGVGQTHVLQASDSGYEYEIEYSISCTQVRVSVIDTLGIAARLLPESFRKAKQDGEFQNQILTTCINRLERYQLKLRQINDDKLIFEGPITVQEILDHIAPKVEERRASHSKATKK